MDMERFHQMPAFMKEEMDNLKRVAAPFLKKRLIFLFIAIPLLLASFVYLSSFWGQAAYGTDSMIKIGCAAAGAAFGMALFRESSYQKRNVQQSVMKYILERMQTSEVLSDERKSRYVRAVKEEPFTVMRSFLEFLNEEEIRRRRLAE
ncbi:YwnF family protein [Bacillus sp. FSL W8-0445]|jgi:NADH:ubiquinone oxidoreductase subunit K|uniref:Beta-ketoacyl synthase n=2 Tax=Bacillus licheniformis TaxID=1402 RepID=Q65E06_BACLD|nr:MULTISPECIES: YwnF family protein [Bacillus]MBJ7885111.1 YwnF family protein [Bacillaceae bacterium HSR45]MDP4082360.1 YwnF family protein [Bacillota bacterium]AAU25334.1 putative Beta-ketoacyl synthase [Bacillus licheniformis DSM 13 = ATCC 14580]AAU42708.1 transmembrane protein YwnF [Bacillus licheniformis DSM 13 = ATCC 14580]AMR12233.1 beta-ketoacyl synthase [Bacillus licheniformis]